MKQIEVEPRRIRNAWMGRISGCQLGKPVEVLAMRQGFDALTEYLEKAEALPLRDYVPCLEDSLVAQIGRASCKGWLARSEPDDDINYTVLALMMLERHGLELSTADVARAWLQRLPVGIVFTAEREAYRVLLDRAASGFEFGAPPGFDLAECAANPFSDWIGAQIRADLYGWVCPGRPELAAELARRDAALSHTGDGIHGAVFIAALGAAIPAAGSLPAAIESALEHIPGESEAAGAVRFGTSLAGTADAVPRLHERYGDLSPVHTVNNLALVVWALLSGEDDFSQAIGDSVAAGWDTDCNGATVGALWGVTGKPIPAHWTDPWQGRVAVLLAGVGELSLDDLVDRTVALARRLSA